MDSNIVVVIPTYNEKDNIVRLIEEINLLKLPIDILIVDDNSPDGTGDLVASAKKTKPNLNIIHRKRKEGLGPAYIEAFRYILNKKNYDYVVQMDADFSHDPKDIPRLLEAIEGCGVVVGSRYTKGGKVSDTWNRLRKFISKSGNLYARCITGLRVNDCTAGFKCYRKGALESLDLNRMFLNGYGFQVQILYELKKNNCTLCEIPIFFDDRRRGTSKMTFNIVLEAFFSLALMRLKEKFFA
ncbi:MAG: polyprenol monophosphomannose synthase [Candidatus Omnitrophota bacterium]|nr:MAG: polyprenol monophosphomannose synthase [Candidatus Omnitrophota bacterium]